MVLLRCYTQYASEFGKLRVARGLEKISYIPIPKKGSAKECSNYRTITLISHTSKVMLKMLKASFSSMWTENSQKCKLDFEGAEELETKLLTCLDYGESQRVPEKTSASLNTQKPLTV